MDNKIKILIAFPFVFVIILFVIANYIPFKTELTETEDRILAFMPSAPAINEKQKITVSNELKIPINFSPVLVEKVRTNGSTIVPEIEHSDSNLSLIVISGKRKMAIIRGTLVREGDIIEGMKIAKIEGERVLLKNKTERWLYLEKAK
jgi:type II secretory pathway component PulC